MGKIIKNQNILVGSGKLTDSLFSLFVCGSSSSEPKCKIEEAPPMPEDNASDEEWEIWDEKMNEYLAKANKYSDKVNDKSKKELEAVVKQSKKPQKDVSDISKLLSQPIGQKYDIDEEELDNLTDEEELDNLIGGGFFDFFVCGSTPQNSQESQEPKESCSPQDLIKNNYKLIINLRKLNKNITDELETLETTKPRLYKKRQKILERSKQVNINKINTVRGLNKLIATKFDISTEEQKNLIKQLVGKKRKTGGKRKTKKVRKHRGIHQTGGKAGKLKKGYKYSGKKLKNGKAEIVKCKSKKC